MGKHDSNEGIGNPFLAGAEIIKNIALLFVKNFKVIIIIALIPAIGFGAYFLANHFINNKKPETKPVLGASGNIEKEENKDKEYYMGYEVLGEIKISSVGIDVKVLNPELNGENYLEDTLSYGSALYYGDGLNELGNTVIIGHNTSDCFFGLKDLKIDDTLTVIDPNKDSKEYTIIEIVDCEPDDFSKFLPMEENSREITLITCESEGTQRLCIKAIAK